MVATLAVAYLVRRLRHIHSQPAMQRPRLVPAAFVLAFAVCVVLASARVPAGGGAGVQPACQFLVSPTRIELTTAAADGTIQVDTQPGCEWTASAGASWFQITSGAAGNGPGTIAYSVSAMPPSIDPLRQGAIQVRWNTPTLGQNVLITQSLGSCSALFLPAPRPDFIAHVWRRRRRRSRRCAGGAPFQRAVAGAELAGLDYVHASGNRCRRRRRRLRMVRGQPEPVDRAARRDDHLLQQFARDSAVRPVAAPGPIRCR